MTNELLSVGLLQHFLFIDFYMWLFLVARNTIQCGTTYFCTMVNILSRRFSGMLQAEYMNKTQRVVAEY